MAQQYSFETTTMAPAPYSTELSDFVSEQKIQFNNAEEFYEHIDTAKLKDFEKVKSGVTHHVKLEFACKGTLRNMRWIDSKDFGVGNEVIKTCYIVTYEIEDDDNSMCTCLHYIYDEFGAVDAFDMVTRICNMINA